MTVQNQILALRKQLNTVVVGQHRLLDRLVISLLTGGHVLVEGLPGLAKTTAVNALADGVHARFKRLQFTPDLLPADLTGSEIYLTDRHEFVFREGPLFNEILLADEINRAPAKVQSALLEAMQEHQVTVGGVTRPLPPLFMVMATQNPIEQAGTYPLPEAQLDRFLLHVVLDYPSADEELQILRLDRARLRGEAPDTSRGPVTAETVLAARAEVAAMHIAPELERYIVDLVGATRAGTEDGAGAHLALGASPRASLAIARAASAEAYLRGRDYVSPDDILAVAPDCLRHRVMLSVQAHMDGVERDAVIAERIGAVPIP
ncbi:AAA family ATPase [Thioalkalivibrio denitrificans]|uniref:AAA family ATPase n=1 Tax=Thioalkalivibrio denitrificans TaxID=108003 RepID=A0A1V3NET8_9GAMM|nr:AAA family ATPase [Thioalkalivibrio denitrificans]OOG23362.1 AAA family ATPase [Thioalkalivibrio denitrificans]